MLKNLIHQKAAIQFLKATKKVAFFRPIVRQFSTSTQHFDSKKAAPESTQEASTPQAATKILPRADQVKSLLSVFTKNVVPNIDLPNFKFENSERSITAILECTEYEDDVTRFEQLGSSVLQLVISDYLYTHFPNLTFEQLVTTQLQFTKRQSLCEIAKQLHFHTILQSNAFISKRDVDDFLYYSILRLIGAIYADKGLHTARDFIVKHVLRRSIDISYMLESFDPKKDLGYLVSHGLIANVPSGPIEYIKIDNKKTPDLFVIQALVSDIVLGEGIGPTVKLAELKAAQDALNRHYALYVKALTPIQKEQEANKIRKQ